jgi:hypothetical protein
MDNLITHAAEPDGDEIRVEELRGEKYLVAPLVLVREKVLNGGYLSPDEIQSSEYGWDGRPVTAPPNTDASGHPTNEDGEFISANRPDVIESMRVGFLGNVEYVDDLQTENDEASAHGLRGEAWIHLKSVAAVGDAAKQATKAMAKGDTLEVSTGYYHIPVDESGEFNGDDFDQRQTNLMPDHLALLPNEKGACSWEDGCGAPRVQSVVQTLEDSSEDTGEDSTQTVELNADVPDLDTSSNTSTLDMEDIDIVENSNDERHVRWNTDAETPTRYGVVRGTNEGATLVEVLRPESDGFVESDVLVERNEDELVEVDELPNVEVMRIIADNLLEQARVPVYDETSDDEWSAPDLSEYVDAPDLDGDTVADLSPEERQDIANHSLLGDPNADTFAEVQFFPVVEPDTGNLNERALDAVISGRGAQADITSDQLESARRVARRLLNDEFDRDLDVDVDVSDEGNEPIDNSDDAESSVWQTVKSYIGFGGDDAPNASSTCTSGACACGLHVTTYMSYDIDELAENSAFDRETLEGWDDDQIANLAESLNMVEDNADDGDDTTSDGDAGDDDGDGDGQDDTNNTDDDLPPEVEERLERLDELESEVDEIRSQSEQERRDELVERVAQAKGHERETLQELDLDTLEALAEDVDEPYDGSYNQGANYAGQGGAGAPTPGDENEEIDDPDDSGYTAQVGVVANMGKAQEGSD